MKEELYIVNEPTTSIISVDTDIKQINKNIKKAKKEFADFIYYNDLEFTTIPDYNERRPKYGIRYIIDRIDVNQKKVKISLKPEDKKEESNFNLFIKSDDFKYIKDIPSTFENNSNLINEFDKINIETNKILVRKDDLEFMEVLFKFLIKLNNNINYSNIKIFFSKNGEKLKTDDIVNLIQKILEIKFDKNIVFNNGTDSYVTKDNSRFVINNCDRYIKKELKNKTFKEDKDGFLEINFDIEDDKITTFHNMYMLYNLVKYILISDTYNPDKNKHKTYRDYYFQEQGHTTHGTVFDDWRLNDDFIIKEFKVEELKEYAEIIKEKLNLMAIKLYNTPISVEDFYHDNALKEYEKNYNECYGSMLTIYGSFPLKGYKDPLKMQKLEDTKTYLEHHQYRDLEEYKEKEKVYKKLIS